jgi:predicted dehydrogenase
VEDLLARSDIDAIYVATPDAAHHAGTLAAAAAGKHVLVEKAMASNADECTEMIAACADNGVTLAVAYYRRCYPSILHAKSLLADGAVGRVQRLWINDQFPTSHRIDLAHFFLGDAVSLRVDVQDLPPDSNAGRGPVLTTRHANGAEAVMNVGWLENHDVEQVIIDGSKGRIVIHDLKAGRMGLSRGTDWQAQDQAPLPFAHQGLMENVSRHLLGRGPLACTGVEGRKSTVILDQISAAGAAGAEHSVSYV